MKVKWKKGPPPGVGAWWICMSLGDFDVDGVHLVSVGPALLNPGGKPMVKFIGGLAYYLDAIEHRISHHAHVQFPGPPGGAGQ